MRGAKYKPIELRSIARANIKEYSQLYDEEYIWYESSDICTIRDISHYPNGDICNFSKKFTVFNSNSYINIERIHYNGGDCYFQVKLK